MACGHFLNLSSMQSQILSGKTARSERRIKNIPPACRGWFFSLRHRKNDSNMGPLIITFVDFYFFADFIIKPTMTDNIA